MKKFKYVFLMILTVLFLGSFNVEAKVGQTAPGSITLSSSDLTPTGVGTNEAVFITKDGNYAYCISPGKEYPKAGTTLKLMGDYNDNAAYYIMSQSLSGTSQYITNQLAIWYAQTATLPSRYANHMNTDLVKKAKALKQNAKLAEALKQLGYDGTMEKEVAPKTFEQYKQASVFFPMLNFS